MVWKILFSSNKLLKLKYIHHYFFLKFPKKKSQCILWAGKYGIHQLPLHNHPDDLNANLEVHNDHFIHNENWLLTPSNRTIDKETETTSQKKEVTYKMTKQMLHLESIIYTNIPLSSKEYILLITLYLTPWRRQCGHWHTSEGTNFYTTFNSVMCISGMYDWL